MAIKKLFYNIGTGPIKEVSGSAYDVGSNKLSLQKLSFSSASFPSLNNIVFSNDKILSSSAVSDDQYLAWNNINSVWNFVDYTNSSTANTPIPTNSDVTGSYLTNATVKSIGNVTSGTLAVNVGGTGRTTQVSVAGGGERLLARGSSNFIVDTTDPYTSGQTSLTLNKPIALAPFTTTSSVDSSNYLNTITRPKGQIVTPPVASPFGGNVLSSSTGGTYTAAITLSSAHTGDFTIEAWTYLVDAGASPDGNKSIIFQSNDATSFSLLVQAASNNSLVGNYGFWDGGSSVPSTGISFIPNDWVHCVLVRSKGVYKAYINGTGSSGLNAAQNTSFSTIYIATNSISSYNINGYMTEFCMNNYAKSEDEIKSYYNSVKAGTRGRYTKDEQLTKTYSNQNRVLNIDTDAKVLTGSLYSPTTSSYTFDGFKYY